MILLSILALYTAVFSVNTQTMALHVGARLAGQRQQLALSPTIILDKLKVEFQFKCSAL